MLKSSRRMRMIAGIGLLDRFNRQFAVEVDGEKLRIMVEPRHMKHFGCVEQEGEGISIFEAIKMER